METQKLSKNGKMNRKRYFLKIDFSYYSKICVVKNLGLLLNINNTLIHTR